MRIPAYASEDAGLRVPMPHAAQHAEAPANNGMQLTALRTAAVAER